MADSPTRTVLAQLLMVVSFLVLNTAFNLYNKWMFTSQDKDGAGLSVPVLATLTHSMAGFLVAYAMSYFPEVYTPKEISGWVQWLNVLAISVFFAVTITCNNSSLAHLPLSLQQTVRSLSPVTLAVCAYFIEDKRFSKKKILALIFLVAGIIMTVATSTDANLLGILFVSISVVSGSLYYTFVSLHMGPQHGLSPIDILYYTAAPVGLMLVPLFAVTNEPNILSTFYSDNGLGKTMALFLIGCLFAVLYNIMTFTFIGALSAVYLSVVANFKLVLLILFGIIVFHEHVSWINALGLVIATSAFGAYSYLEYLDKVAAAAAKESSKKESPKETEKSV